MRRICKNDYTDELRRLFDANPLRIPQGGFQPLTMLEIHKRRPRVIGQFHQLVNGSFENRLQVKSEKVAEFSNMKSQKLSMGLGLDILENYLQAFGMSSVGIDAQIKKHDEFSFSFSNVRRRYIDLLGLGKLLSENDVRPMADNIFANFEKSKDSKMAIVVDAIVSNDISISVYNKNDRNVDLSVPAIEATLANAKLQVGVSSEAINEISFKQKDPLTFAFSCKEILIEKGRFKAGPWIETSRSIGPGMGKTTANLLDDGNEDEVVFIDIESYDNSLEKNK